VGEREVLDQRRLSCAQGGEGTVAMPQAGYAGALGPAMGP
jgi:hypothetical protein